MSRNVAAPKPSAKKKPDLRAMRTRDRLGDALILLIQEKPFEEITVQEVLDRAGVGRSTFYSHYRDKNDLFLSDLDEFLEHFASLLSRKKEHSDRVAPVKEFFTHVKDGKQIHDSLMASGHLHDFFDLAQGHFARGIERRMKESPRWSGLKADAIATLAQAHAGAFLALLRMWIQRGMKTSPVAMDKTFHDIVWGRR